MAVGFYVRSLHNGGMPEPIVIESLDDPRVEPYRDVRDKDLRGRVKFFMGESEMVIRRLLRTPERLHSVFLSHNKYERLKDELHSLPGEVYVADIDLMTAIAGFHIHRGVLAVGFRPSPSDVALDAALGHLKEKSSCTMLVCEGLTNVDNMGGLFRNAAAFGVDGIVLDPTCCDPLYRKAIRVSMGHTLSVPYGIAGDWPADLKRLKDQWGVKLIAAEVSEDSKPLWEISGEDRIAILFGSEGHGLSAEALAQCDEVCEIPMHPHVPSLNVAVTSAVFLYELQRATGC